jgi:2,5-dihydroxypyridine 5,6-dioxygenase
MSTADMISPTSFADLCRSELELCRVRPGETLVVLSQGYERQEYVDAFLAA